MAENAKLAPVSATAPPATAARRPAAAPAAEDYVPLIDLGAFLRESPPWLVSAIVHMLIMIVMGLLLARMEQRENLMLDVGFADDLGPGLTDDLNLTDETFTLEDQTFSPSNLPIVEDPFSTPNVTNFAPIPVMPSGTIMPGAIGSMLAGRDPGMRQAMVAAGGGNAATEGAVTLGLKWLASKQQNDGTWSLRGPYSNGAGAENVPAATAMAILAFQGAGYTPEGDPKEPFTQVVARGWKALLKMQDEHGKFWEGLDEHHSLYTQAQCTIALSELYGMTKDEQYHEPAQRAVDYCVKIQAANGGWRYRVGEPGDLSVTGWFVMALQSARMAGLEVPSPVFDNISRFLDEVARGDEHGYEVGSRYSYQIRNGATVSMTAEGLLCRQFLGWPRNDTRLLSGVDYLVENLPNWENRNVYYWYYATQVLHHMEGQEWRKWNAVMRKMLPEKQEKTGRERGSWPDPAGDRWGGQGYGGRLYVTCLSIYILEVYYRHLPLYQSGLVERSQ